MTAILAARSLSAGYGDSRVLRGIDLDIEAGETIGLMGRNGMGKTTLIRTLIGLLPAQEGVVLLDGVDAAVLPVFARARRGIAVVPEGRGIFASLTVMENLRLAATRGCRRGYHWGGLDRSARAGSIPPFRPTRFEPGQPPLRRRTADAGDRPSVDDQPKAADFG